MHKYSANVFASRAIKILKLAAESFAKFIVILWLYFSRIFLNIFKTLSICNHNIN